MISYSLLPRTLPNREKVTAMPRLTDSNVKAIKPPQTGQSEYPDDLVTGLRLRVGAGGRKAWIVRTRAGGKPINRTIGSYPVMKLAVARGEAQKLLVDIQKGGAPRPVHTFQELVDHWIETEARPKNSSWRLQQRAAELHVLPKWATRAIDGISRGEVRDLIDGIEGHVAPNRVLALVRKLFRHGLSRDWISVSPAEAIAKPNAEKPRDRFLEMKEVAHVYRAAELLGYPYGGFIKTLLLTGQRRTEVASMRWNDIDIEAATWMIGSADTKAGRAQLVPLSSAVIDILKSAPKIGSYVWTTNGTSYIQNFTKAKNKLDSFLAADSSVHHQWRLHDLRRTAATHMVRLGVSETIVGRVLNHAPQGVTARVYALHSYAPEKRSAFDRWATEVEREVSAMRARTNHA
jgi:integrase